MSQLNLTLTSKQNQQNSQRVLDNLQHNKWEIYLDTRLFWGLDTVPVQEHITLPLATKDFIDRFIIAGLHVVLADESFNDTSHGIHALELAANKIINEKVVPPNKLRVDLYPGEHGLCVVVNIKFDPATLVAEIEDKGKEITYEDTLHRRIT